MASAFYVSVLYCSSLSAEKLKKTSMEILFLKQKSPKNEQKHA